VSPFKLLWINLTGDPAYPMQIAFSAPKKNFPRAVDRNRIKRLCREAYRQNKQIIYDFLNKKQENCAGMLIYTSKSMLSYEESCSKIIATLKRFKEKYETFR